MECPWVAQGRKGGGDVEAFYWLGIMAKLTNESPWLSEGLRFNSLWGLTIFFVPCSWLAADVSWQFLKSGIYILKLKFIFEF